MKKLDPAVRRECAYIGAVTLILSVLMQAIFLIGGWWDYTVLLGNLWGALIAIGNFLLLAHAVTRAVGKEEKEAKEILRASHSVRLLLQFSLALVGVLIPAFHMLSVLIPLLFPRVALLLYPMVKSRIENAEKTDEQEKRRHE